MSMLLLLFWLLLLLCVSSADDDQISEDEDDFTPTVYSPGKDVELVHKYPHLSTSLQEQDRTFMTNEETTRDYIISLVVFPAIVSGVCLIFVCCLFACLCWRCWMLGCINFWKITCRICKKDCFKMSKKRLKRLTELRGEFYEIFSKTFFILLLCSAIAIAWIWVGASQFGDGVNETQGGLTAFGNIVQAISDELQEMSSSGRSISKFLSDNSCPERVSKYLEDIGENFVQFVNVTEDAARITASVKPAIDNANDKIDEYWDSYQVLAFDMSAVALFGVVTIYSFGVCMKTAILIRLGLLLAMVVSFALCIIVFIEMVAIMGYSDFCMAPTHHIERSLKGLLWRLTLLNLLTMVLLFVAGMAYEVVHYYSTCDGNGPLFQPVDDSKYYNSLMNKSYFDMIEEFPLLNANCRKGVSFLVMSLQ